MNQLDLTFTLNTALNFQNEILSKVSRSFALTIPELPAQLKDAVANCYLWCRVTDTLEDDMCLTLEQKIYFHQKLIEILNNNFSAQQFIDELYKLLSNQTSEDEKLLILNLHSILYITNALPAEQKLAVQECVIIMNNLMPKFEKIASINGLEDLPALNKYCYAVAGVVGEMLTKLFCHYGIWSKEQQDTLIPLAQSFGQALQMTNILKDRWNDYSRKICWLPKNFFNNTDFNTLLQNPSAKIFAIGIKKLININYEHLHNALNYVLLIPPKEVGIRRFCLWAIGISIETLRGINQNPCFTDVKQIKISRRKLRLIILITNSIVKYNRLLIIWFKLFSYGLKSKREF